MPPSTTHRSAGADSMSAPAATAWSWVAMARYPEWRLTSGEMGSAALAAGSN
jgi:hypothetical protein